MSIILQLAEISIKIIYQFILQYNKNEYNFEVQMNIQILDRLGNSVHLPFSTP